MIKCQVCGFENKDDAQFCLNCGSPISRQKLSEAVDDVSEEATIMLDPAAMQRRMQEEFAKSQQEKAPEQPAPAAVPAPKLPQPKAPVAPPAAAPALSKQEPAAPKPSGEITITKTQLLMIIGVLAVLVVILGLIVLLR